ncbi:hypothetical protein M422DRAFT_30260 [Sphaerobolus stellatus SS14]|uniref:Unplaced genomic scaffold SPHSTscaffold_40, whole genome shotgun sequence n=1 Tax=Sphaerobolus stellatus (strain SS14) TaxID=990650 RepID=A0A0C9VR13_SPHS4|nr:hypothetical protein M422DRAFT_30260 [Sphaerobolus stellatus SS14]
MNYLRIILILSNLLLLVYGSLIPVHVREKRDMTCSDGNCPDNFALELEGVEQVLKDCQDCQGPALSVSDTGSQSSSSTSPRPRKFRRRHP